MSQAELAAVLVASKGEVWTGKKNAPWLTPLHVDDRVVGFYHPREEPLGVRLGPVWILPEFRGRGIATELYRTAFPEKAVVAFVVHENAASQRMLTKAGFERWRRASTGWLWRRGPVKAAAGGATPKGTDR